MGNAVVRDLIAKAAVHAHQEDAERAVRWIYRGAWRLDDASFAELLDGEYLHLTDDDRAELHSFRRRLLGERAE
jgi:hypothetical protein